MIDVMHYENGDDDRTYTVEDERVCPLGKCYADCGPRGPDDCRAWHKDPVPLTALRSPAHLTRTGDGEFEWNAPGERQAVFAIIAQDRHDGVEVGMSSAWRAR